MGPTHSLPVILPVHLELIKGVTPGISDQLSDDSVLHPLQEVPQAGQLQPVLEEQLLLRLGLCLGAAGGGGPRLHLGLSSVHGAGLTASLKCQQNRMLIIE